MRLTAKKVAEATVELIQHPRQSVILPGYLKSVIWLNRTVPALVDWLIQKCFVEQERSPS
jgi:short-subunit dehydrogenase